MNKLREWITLPKIHVMSLFYGAGGLVLIVLLGYKVVLAFSPDSLRPLVEGVGAQIVEAACGGKMLEAENAHQLALYKKDVDCGLSNQAAIIATVENQAKRTLRLCQRLTALEVIVCQTQNGGDARLCANVPATEECR